MSRNESQPSTVPSSRYVHLWLSVEPGANSSELVYRPAIFVDCIINFRSIKAGVNDSQERAYTTWLSDGTLPVNWDSPAIEPPSLDKLEMNASPDVAMPRTEIVLDEERTAEIEADLVDLLVRRERLKLLYNPLFKLFSGIDESEADFTARVAEAVLDVIEPEMKKLKSVFDLRLEQIRETQRRKGGPGLEESNDADGGKADLERLLLSRTEFLATEKRVATVFTGRADAVLKLPTLRPDYAQQVPGGPTLAPELQDDLRRVEEEAVEALGELYSRYLDMVQSYDVFEVGIQPANIRILRRAILWVPVRKS